MSRRFSDGGQVPPPCSASWPGARELFPVARRVTSDSGKEKPFGGDRGTGAEAKRPGWWQSRTQGVYYEVHEPSASVEASSWSGAAGCLTVSRRAKNAPSAAQRSTAFRPQKEQSRGQPMHMIAPGGGK